MRLAGRSALVTGAGGGIGGAIAWALAREGCRVAVCSRTGTSEITAKNIVAAGHEAIPFKFDVSDEVAVRRGVRLVIDRFDGLDILVNNAGTNIGGPLCDTTPADADQMMRVNFFGPMFCMQSSFDALAESGSGRIVNIASWVARTPVPGFVAYSASKAALLSMTRGAALEFADSGVTVNAVCPGNVWTGIWQSATGSSESQALRAFQESVADQPIKRGVEPEEVANAVLFFASDHARGITGEALFVASGL